MIIAIDGTSGSGKSTLAKNLAKVLNFGFFSAGALYRAITVKVLNLHLETNDDEKLKYMIENTEIIYSYDGNKNVMLLDGMNISDKLYTEDVSNTVAKVACKPYIREYVRKLQRDTKNHNEDLVMEGRDIGSVIFPNAELKIYVDCKVETRAKRRLSECQARGENVTYEMVLDDLKDRDYKDMHREISPLVMCEDAFLIDTSNTPADECLEMAIKELFRRNLISKEMLDNINTNL